MTMTDAPTGPGAFLQLIEYRTEHPEEMEAIIGRWVTGIGANRTARWYATTADRDQPGLFVQIVEFPSYAEAMANSGHPATSTFAAELSKCCTGDIVFRNLDVTVSRQL